MQNRSGAGYEEARGHTLSTGDRTEVPFRCRRADACLLFGRVDLAAVTAVLAPEGLAPVRLADGSGVGVLWFLRYEDSTAGEYTEGVFTIAAAQAPRGFAGTGPFAAVAAAADPDVRLFVQRLILRRQDTLAIAYGRELLHLDKLPVDRLEITRAEQGGSTRKIIEVQSAGRTLVEASLLEGGSLLTELSATARLARAALPSVVRRIRRGLELTCQAPLRMGGGTIAAVLAPPLPRVRPFGASDTLRLHPGHPFTDDVLSSGFAAGLVMHIRRFGFVMHPAK